MRNVIYKIRNVLNNSYYIGSTVDSRKRFWAHRKSLRAGSHDCAHLQRAWNKYGEDVFKFEIVEQLESKEGLYPAEQKWLNEHFGADYCYNTAAHADSPMRDASDEMRQRLAEKTKTFSETHGSPRLGHRHTEETKERIRQKKLADPVRYWEGKTRSEETKAKISATQKGKPKALGRKVSEEGLAKIKANIEAGRSHMHWLGKQHTEDAKAKMSRPVVAVSPTAVETVYASITALRDALGLKPPTVNRALKSGEPLTRGKFAGWKFAYVASTEPA
jgi:group I intron endonuclease